MENLGTGERGRAGRGSGLQFQGPKCERKELIHPHLSLPPSFLIITLTAAIMTMMTSVTVQCWTWPPCSGCLWNVGFNWTGSANCAKVSGVGWVNGREQESHCCWHLMQCQWMLGWDFPLQFCCCFWGPCGLPFDMKQKQNSLWEKRVLLDFMLIKGLGMPQKCRP